MALTYTHCIGLFVDDTFDRPPPSVSGVQIGPPLWYRTRLTCLQTPTAQLGRLAFPYHSIFSNICLSREDIEPLDLNASLLSTSSLVPTKQIPASASAMGSTRDLSISPTLMPQASHYGITLGSSWHTRNDNKYMPFLCSRILSIFSKFVGHQEISFPIQITQH